MDLTHKFVEILILIASLTTIDKAVLLQHFVFPR